MDHEINDQPVNDPQLSSPEREEGSPTWDNYKKEDAEEGDLMKNQDGARSQKLKGSEQDNNTLAAKKNPHQKSSSRVLKFSEYFS